MCPG